MTPPPTPPLPRGWPRHARRAVLHVISLAHVAIQCAWARATTSGDRRRRLPAALDRARAESALLVDELRILTSRLRRIEPRRRPHYRPTERLAILEIKAARGWSQEETARRFLLEPATVGEWGRRVDEEGSGALIQTEEPVNRFPDLVRHAVRRLKALCPTLGKKRIGEILARAGIHLGVTTVGRMLKERARGGKPPAEPSSEPESPSPAGRGPALAKRPHHVWQIDLTVVPTSGGLSTPWLPFALPPLWPFCWWLGCIVDEYSRRVVSFALWRRQPTSPEVRSFLARAVAKARSRPRYILSDRGGQFTSAEFRSWCRQQGIRHRYASTGKGSRATSIIERFFRSLKDEWLRSGPVPLRHEEMRREVALYLEWFHRWRPHQGLGGRTPQEVYEARMPASTKPRVEPRPRWPRGSPCAEPRVGERARSRRLWTISILFHGGRRQLPIVEVKKAA